MTTFANAAKADSVQFDAFMVLSRPHGEEPQFRTYPDSATSCAASRTMGPPHPSRRAPRNDCVSRKRMCLRPPQDEADRRAASVLPIHFQRDCSEADLHGSVAPS
jgi:hypothetical protein